MLISQLTFPNIITITWPLFDLCLSKPQERSQGLITTYDGEFHTPDFDCKAA